MNQKNRMVAWGIQDLTLKIESLEVLDIPFTITKIVPKDLVPLSQFIIEFDVVVLPEESNEAPVQYHD